MRDKKLSIPPRLFTDFSNKLSKLKINTICDSALCINRPECFKKGKITFLVMGDICTRNCRYCGVNKGIPVKLDPNEPKKVSIAVKRLDLKYVVITSVTRDDLFDQGANHFSKIISVVKKNNPGLKIEVLIPDFWGKKQLLSLIIDSKPDVINHNIECTKNRFKILRPRGNYNTSLKTLKYIKIINPTMMTKSGFMIGVGETFIDIKKTIIDLRENLVDIVTIGQYLPPNNISFPLIKLYKDNEYSKIRKYAESLNWFKKVFVAANVRSSYHADEQIN